MTPKRLGIVYVVISVNHNQFFLVMPISEVIGKNMKNYTSNFGVLYIGLKTCSFIIIRVMINEKYNIPLK
jgi:hypothetical protein